jgi:chemotaxis signal transduction protein
MINLRGNLLPVFDIKQLLDMTSPETSKWIIVFGQDDRATGIYADTLPSGVTIDRPADETPQLHEFLQDCVENTLMQGEHMWVEVTFEKMFEGLRARL